MSLPFMASGAERGTGVSNTGIPSTRDLSLMITFSKELTILQ
ncbi:MAG: hypothetical protein ACP5KC_09450 [Infirmifilum sp.]